jgi:hypothetical protein
VEVLLGATGEVADVGDLVDEGEADVGDLADEGELTDVGNLVDLDVFTTSDPGRSHVVSSVPVFHQ